MNKKISGLVAVMLLMVPGVSEAAKRSTNAESVTTTEEIRPFQSNDRPVSITAEILGRGLLYSLNLDYLVLNRLAIGVGISALPGGMLIPAYVNFYFAGASEHRGYLTAGGTTLIGTGSFNSKTGSVGALATGGVGYEYRDSDGFLFRVAPYVIGNENGIIPFLGISGGISL